MANERYEGVGLDGHYTLAERIFTKIKSLFDTKVKTDVPANAVFTDEKVKQNETTSEAQYEILFSGTADDVTRIEETRKHSKLLYNPYSQTLTVGTKEDPYARGVITLRGGTDSPAYLNVDGVISVLNSDMGCLFVKSNDIELFSSVDPSYTWDGVNTSLKDALGAIEDTKVTQTESTSNDTYEVLVAGTASTATTTEGANKSTGLRINPNLKAIMEGTNTLASSVSSHAEGNYTTASGSYSHAEGEDTKAAGQGTHAEGYGTYAYGNYNHAEGSRTTATDSYSHAEGIYTYAGNGSHAEGQSTTAGYYGHAEGEYTYASGDGSHAEGYQSYAKGTAAHAEGYKTSATYTHAHSEGIYTLASGSSGTHAEGLRTTASGGSSHAEGDSNLASGSSSHAEGYSSRATGDYTHAENNHTCAKGNYSHTEGSYTTATHKSQHVFGEYNDLDASTATSGYRGTYVEIVGNGLSSTQLSNARTLDWDGNEKIAGNLTDKWGLQTSRDLFQSEFDDLTQEERDNGTTYYIKDGEPLRICDYIYPVGAIYMSVNNISPAILFGGTWERIKDRFLLAAGDDYNAGSTGGEAEHTLSIDEMPLHRHTERKVVNNGGQATIINDTVAGTYSGDVMASTKQVSWYENKAAVSTHEAGRDQPHNNMPPYLTVNVWMRVPDPVEQEEENNEEQGE